MGKKKKCRINSSKGYKKNLLVILSLLLLAVVVYAVAPTTPNSITPANNTIFFNDTLQLTCSGSSGEGTIYYQYYIDSAEENETTSTVFNLTGQTIGRTYEYKCRACNDTTTSTTVLDNTGNGYTAQNNGADTINGLLGNGFEFISGNSDFINSTWVDDSRAITFWINTTQTSGGVAGQRYDTTESDGDWNFQLNSGNAQLVFYECSGGACDIIATGGAINDGSWHFITLVANNSNNKIEIWIDGALSAAESGDVPYDGGSFGSGLTGNNSFQLGRFGEGGWTYFTGMIDEVGIWNATLNGSFISTLYNSGNGLDPVTAGYTGNLEVYYNFNSSVECSDFTGIHNLNVMNFTSCPSGNIALNLTFENENNTGTKINGAIDSLTFTFGSNDSETESYTYSNSTDSSNFAFCLEPENVNLPINGSINYEASGFQQRKINIDRSIIGNTTHQQVLYLLGTGDGIYVTFQVVDAGEDVIEGATVTATRTIGGSEVEISSGLTDSSGGVTFWLDPNAQHTIAATKSGVGSTSVSLTPTQSTYTLIIGGVSLINQTSPFIGITYDILPNNIILTNNTNYNFSFELDSGYWNLTNWGFSLSNATDQIQSTTNNTIGGGTLRIELNTGNHTEINMDYWWNIDGNYTNLTRTWDVENTYVGSLSIKNFFNDFASYAAVGFNAGYNNFTAIIVSIIILVLAVGGLSFAFGIYSPLGIMSLTFAIVFLLETVNIIPPLVRQYLLTAILGIILLAYFIKEQST